MKPALRVLLSAALAVLAAAATAQEPLRSAARSFTIHLDAPPAATAPLFGPVREAEWAPTWTPRFLHPAAPAQVEGAVFTTDGPHGTLTWLLSRFDERAGVIDYEVLAPGYALTRISIRVAPGRTANTSDAVVTYRRMALAPEANTYVEEFERHFESQGPHWQEAINAAIAKGAR
jgi:hypothetical protein